MKRHATQQYFTLHEINNILAQLGYGIIDYDYSLGSHTIDVWLVKGNRKFSCLLKPHCADYFTQHPRYKYSMEPIIARVAYR